MTGSKGSIWVSRDRGETWAELNPALTFTTVQGHSQLEVVPGEADTVFVGTWGGGSFRSDDSGRNWTTLDDTHLFSPTCIEAWPADPDIVYACDRTEPVIHRSSDGGATWEKYFDFGPGHLTTTAVAIDPSDPDVIYASAFRPPAAMLGSFYRIRAGAVEADLGAGLPRAVLDIAIDRSAPDNVYVTTHLHGLFASADAGETWRRLDDLGTGLPRTGYLDVDVHPGDSQTLYASSLCGPIPAYVIAPLRAVLGRGEPFPNIDPNAACGLYRSRDGGNRWELLLETEGEAKGVEVSPAHPGSLWVADGSGGVWVSDDDGATWHQENDGLGTTSVTAVAMGTDRLYAGTQGSGVFVGTIAADGSISWDGAESPRAYVYRVQIELDPRERDRHLRLGLSGRRHFAATTAGAPGVPRTSSPPASVSPTPSYRATTRWTSIRAIRTRSGSASTGRVSSSLAMAATSGHSPTGTTVSSRASTSPRSRWIRWTRSVSSSGPRKASSSPPTPGGTWRRWNKGLGVRDVRSLELTSPASGPSLPTSRTAAPDGFELQPGWSVARGRLIGTRPPGPPPGRRRGRTTRSRSSSTWTAARSTSIRA